MLERKRINYCIHSRDFIVGKAIIENIADSVYNSRKVLAIISHNYLSSHFCREELEIALYRCTEMADSSLLLIRVDHVDKDRLPKTLRRRTFLDYASALERMDWERRLLKHIEFDDKNSTQLGSPSASTVQLLSEQSNIKRVWSAEVVWRRTIYEMWADSRTRLTITKPDKRDVNNAWLAVTALLIHQMQIWRTTGRVAWKWGYWGLGVLFWQCFPWKVLLRGRFSLFYFAMPTSFCVLECHQKG